MWWRERGSIQKYLFLPSRRLKAVGYQRAERQRRGFAGTSWIGAEAGNGSGTGCGGPYEGVGCVHDLVMVHNYSKGVKLAGVCALAPSLR